MGNFNLKIYILKAIFLISLCFSCADNETFNEKVLKDLSTKESQNKLSKTKKNKITYASKHFLEEPQLVEFIIDYNDKLSAGYSSHIKKVCDYAKIPFRSSNIKHWNSPNFEIPPSVRVVCVNKATALNDVATQKLLSFISRGGTLLKTTIIEDERFDFFYGFNLDAKYENDSKAAGFKFVKPMLPCHKGITYHKNFIHYGLRRENFKNDVKPLIVAANDTNFPVVLENKIGKGKVIFFNSVMMIDRNFRGIAFSSLLSGLEGVPYPIANVSTIYLDDFPSPVYNIMKEPIASEMGMTMAEFTHKVWWPDMLKLAKEFDIDYTTTITFDYNIKVTPPFLFTQWETNKIENTNTSLSNWFTKEVQKHKHELAFHGYNHVSLQKSDWKNPEYIRTALETVKKKWKVEKYGALPVSYIPPSNMIDSIGLSKLKLSLPSIKYMCSSYFGEVNEGEGREFDIDPYNRELFDYPRVTSEYLLNNQKMFSKESLYLFTGIWTHFVHPDDVFQIKDESNKKTTGDYDFRNALGLGWHISKDGSPGLYPRFKSLLAAHKKMFPYTRFVNAIEGGAIVNKWRTASYNHQNTNNLYTVKKIGVSNPGKYYWFVYVSYDNLIDMEMYLYSKKLNFNKASLLNGYLINIETKYPVLNVPNYNTMLEKNDDSEYLLAFKEYYTHLNELRSSEYDTLISEDVEEYNEEVALKQELANLKEKMFSKKTIDTAYWNSYARINNWQNNEQVVWEDLDVFYKINPTLPNALYADELSKISWYPKESTKEKWLSEKIKLTKNNIGAMKEYVKLYNTKENTKRITTYLKLIATLEPTIEHKNNYIKHILWSNSSSALKILNAISPSLIYSEIAKDAAWFYHEKGYPKKAYKWAKYTEEIDFAIKLDWLYTLNEFDSIKPTYEKHIQLYPNDDKAKAAMAHIHHVMGEFKEAWIISNSISDGFAGKQLLKDMLNKDVKYVSLDMQRELVENYAGLFKVKVKDSLVEHIRIKSSNSIAFNGIIGSDKASNTSFEKMSTYNMVSKKRYVHGVSFVNSNVYALKTPIVDEDNVDRELYGFQYKINNPSSHDKLQYWSKIRVEKDAVDKMFYQFGAGASLSRKYRFSSVEYNIYPVKNGVAHSKGIYRNMLGVYYEKRFKRPFSAIGYLEGNYYTDDVLSTSFTGKFLYNVIKKPYLKLHPFLEGEYSYGTKNSPNGYPYWILKNRIYGGGGLGGRYGNEDNSKFLFSVDAAYFVDDYSERFSRFNGKTSIRFLKYYMFQASFEYYNQSEYYSNRFNFGLKYYLK